MLSKLPRWVWLGGGVLAFSAGMINAIALLGFSHQAATHVTGIFSHLSIALYRFENRRLAETLCIIFCFLFGAVLSGIILRDAHLKMGRRYGFALAVECLLLLLSTYGFHKASIWGEYCASMAAGLQNALASTYSGAIIRTTHLTGILTDLGVLIGHSLQGMKIEIKRIQLYLILIFSFLAGGFSGAFSYEKWNAMAMLIPAAIIGFCSFAYHILRLQNTSLES